MTTVLDGKTALVTGAASGLGYGIAAELGKAGARIAVLDVDDRAALVAISTLADLGVEARA